MLQRLRIVTGLINFTYVSTHFLNHSLGLISLEAAEAGQLVFLAFWRHPLATAILYTSLLLHLGLVLFSIYRRRHLRIPVWDLFRISLGLCIPLFLIGHLSGTRLLYEETGIYDTYTRVVLNLWVVNPWAGAQQFVLLTIAWIHGSLGIHYWLKPKRWHQRWVPTLRVVGLLYPTFALLGYVVMGQELAQRIAADPTWLARTFTPVPPDKVAVLDSWRYGLLGTYLGLVALVFVGRWLRAVLERRRKGVIRLTYPGGRRVEVVPGTTLLEASRGAGIPHASLCGGRGRCSTCRTRIGEGYEAMPAPSAVEERVLRRVGAPPNIRLACQLQPNRNVDVFPQLSAVSNITTGLRSLQQSQGQELEVAILFSDLRSFTKFSENRLPYDVVFVLNQYFAAVGTAVERSGGYLDKFIGDGTMALFGLHGDVQRGCREALEACVGMARALDELNSLLANELREPLKMGIGLHVGHVIVGEMGHGPARTLTAIGDAVNTASRLEPLNKEYGSSLLVVSEDVAIRAGIDLSPLRREQVPIRGRDNALQIFIAHQASELEPLLSR